MGCVAIMNAFDLVYWAMNATSLFNTILLFWLGWTVLLNAQKRNGGTWLATIGLLLGGIFFATHTAMLYSSIEELFVTVRLWWYFFFTPIVILPYAWYLLMLWYAGFWDDFSSRLYLRHLEFGADHDSCDRAFCHAAFCKSFCLQRRQ